MTSRTIDIHCHSCGTYMFSLQPDNYKGLQKDYYCESDKCKLQATADTLKNKPKNNGRSDRTN